MPTRVLLSVKPRFAEAIQPLGIKPKRGGVDAQLVTLVWRSADDGQPV